MTEEFNLETTRNKRKTNKSAAVLAQRVSPVDGLDDFPSQPWAGRAWAHYLLGGGGLHGLRVWEPAANRGYLVRGLADYCDEIICSDIHDYGVGYNVFDFLKYSPSKPPAFINRPVHYVVTNPPFNRLVEFALVALQLATHGVALLVRTQALESLPRWRTIFKPYAENYTFSVFVERLSLVAGTVDPEANLQTSYGWLTIFKTTLDPAFIASTRHIPPCRAQMERPGDYDPPICKVGAPVHVETR